MIPAFGLRAVIAPAGRREVGEAVFVTFVCTVAAYLAEWLVDDLRAGVRRRRKQQRRQQRPAEKTGA